MLFQLIVGVSGSNSSKKITNENTAEDRAFVEHEISGSVERKINDTKAKVWH